MLPARGPRPTLKGESQITVRLMDDIQIPRMTASGQYYERPASYDRPPRPVYRRQSFDRPPARGKQRSSEPAHAVTDTPEEAVPDVTYSAQVVTTPEIQPVASDPSSQQAELAAPDSTTARKPLRTRWIALKPGSVYEVTNYSIHEGSVTYVLSNGATGSVDITEVDWRKTSHLNAEPTASSTATRTAVTSGVDSFSGRP
jgi:hypothetical protein